MHIRCSTRYSLVSCFAHFCGDRHFWGLACPCALAHRRGKRAHSLKWGTGAGAVSGFPCANGELALALSTGRGAVAQVIHRLCVSSVDVGLIIWYAKCSAQDSPLKPRSHTLPGGIRPLRGVGREKSDDVRVSVWRWAVGASWVMCRLRRVDVSTCPQPAPHPVDNSVRPEAQDAGHRPGGPGPARFRPAGLRPGRPGSGPATRPPPRSPRPRSHGAAGTCPTAGRRPAGTSPGTARSGRPASAPSGPTRPSGP